ncbi:hypothetical protein [Enterococcus lactis]|uniref:hypothetical protein n=1 Tax=Enterococcus lactis TaxID=357441 RepID=UPI0022DFFA42|nr:hypothetical protein [Enterococcus lactis]
MNAIVINQFGPASELQSLDLSPQDLAENEVLITNHAFSINPMDIAGRQGLLGKPFNERWSFPRFCCKVLNKE